MQERVAQAIEQIEETSRPYGGEVKEKWTLCGDTMVDMEFPSIQQASKWYDAMRQTLVPDLGAEIQAVSRFDTPVLVEIALGF